MADRYTPQKQFGRDEYGRDRHSDYYRDSRERDREREAELDRAERADKAEKAKIYRQKEAEFIKLHADLAGALQKIAGLEKDLTRSEERANKLEAKYDTANEKKGELQDTIIELKAEIMQLKFKHGHTSPQRDRTERNVRPRLTTDRAQDNAEELSDSDDPLIIRRTPTKSATPTKRATSTAKKNNTRPTTALLKAVEDAHATYHYTKGKPLEKDDRDDLIAGLMAKDKALKKPTLNKLSDDTLFDMIAQLSITA